MTDIGGDLLLDGCESVILFLLILLFNIFKVFCLLPFLGVGNVKVTKDKTKYGEGQPLHWLYRHTVLMVSIVGIDELRLTKSFCGNVDRNYTQAFKHFLLCDSDDIVRLFIYFTFVARLVISLIRRLSVP